MKILAITRGDAFLLVYSIEDAGSFEEVRHEREFIINIRPLSVSTIVVGNKCDLESDLKVRKELAESTVTVDWENWFIEVSAKTDTNISNIYNNVLKQARALGETPILEQRRRSLPIFTSPKVKDGLILKLHSCVIS
ncbi:ras-related protein Rap1-like [Tachypleus tridentatus]|uniref:ras-related protein Rap1-like n=1 Tax=Tachypleus tridentatus TaxID=6853 RepID=UPI003FD1791A